MRRAVALVAAGVVLGAVLAASGVAFGGTDIKGRQRLHFVAKQDQFQAFDRAPAGPSLGDQTFSSAVLERNGTTVGSLDYWDTKIDGQVNVAISPRQPGSSVKVFNYLTAYERGYVPEEEPAARLRHFVLRIHCRMGALQLRAGEPVLGVAEAGSADHPT